VLTFFLIPIEQATLLTVKTYNEIIPINDKIYYSLIDLSEMILGKLWKIFPMILKEYNKDNKTWDKSATLSHGAAQC